MNTVATFIAQNRFGLGAAATDTSTTDDPRAWLKSQVNRKAVKGPAGFKSSADILENIHTTRNSRKEKLGPVVKKSYRTDFAPEVLARAQHMVTTDTPFAERMVLFWSNHFTVSNAKRIIGPALPAFEREAIRPHVFGRFADMLKASSRHPVMLSYLDNDISVGESSFAGRRQRSRTGAEKTINENLAREILELHTLGVNGGYSQQDVIELAKAISGWSHGGIRPRRDPKPVHGEFEFKDYFHEPGAKTILGKTYRNDGELQGLAVLDDLARHPATADFIATKLVRHFVADDPPAAAVESISSVFRRTGGDLASVSLALIDLEQAWSEPTPKVKNHYEFLISAHRALGFENLRPGDVFEPLEEFGQLPFSAPSPAGWGDLSSDWLAPEALMRRVEWVRSRSARLPGTWIPEEFLEHTIGPVAYDATRTWVSRAPSGDSAMAIVLASPEFQRR